MRKNDSEWSQTSEGCIRCVVCWTVYVCVYVKASVGAPHVWTCTRSTMGTRSVLTRRRRWRHQPWRQHLLHKVALARSYSCPASIQQPYSK